MRIQVVEDDAIKLERIGDALQLFGRTSVCIARSYNSGLRALIERPPSLGILDMTLPTFDRSPDGLEGRSRPLGGYEIMRKLSLRGQSTPIVVLTALESFGEGKLAVTREAINLRCRREFPGIYKGAIFYSTTDEWIKSLFEVLNSLGA